MIKNENVIYTIQIFFTSTPNLIGSNVYFNEWNVKPHPSITHFHICFILSHLILIFTFGWFSFFSLTFCFTHFVVVSHNTISMYLHNISHCTSYTHLKCKLLYYLFAFALLQRWGMTFFPNVTNVSIDSYCMYWIYYKYSNIKNTINKLYNY